MSKTKSNTIMPFGPPPPQMPEWAPVPDATDTAPARPNADLATDSAVLDLAQIQRDRAIPDADFVRSVALDFSGSSWGKIKAGTFSGDPARARRKVSQALAIVRVGGVTPQTVEGVVLLPHVVAAADAMAAARRSQDEHKLVVIAGESGGGKTATLRHLARETGGTVLSATPSWGGSYLRSLAGLACGLGLGDLFRSAADAERAVLSALTSAPRAVLIDEANHFNRDFINFLKTILNETRSAVAIATLPGHLARMSAQHSEEARQLLRRAVAVVHIPAVSSADVEALGAALFPAVRLGGHAPALASAANRLHRLDTLARILDEADAAGTEDLAAVAALVERQFRPVATSPRR